MLSKLFPDNLQFICEHSVLSPKIFGQKEIKIEQKPRPPKVADFGGGVREVLNVGANVGFIVGSKVGCDVGNKVGFDEG